MLPLELLATIEQLRNRRASLLFTRLELASTLLSMAETATHPDKQLRCEQLAVRAYEAIARDYQRMKLRPDEHERFTEHVIGFSKRLHIHRTARELRQQMAQRKHERDTLAADLWRIRRQWRAMNASTRTH